MSLTTITAYAATPLYDRPPQRRRAWNAPDGRSSSEASPAAQAAALLDAEAVPAPSFEAASYVPHVFRADLTAIASQYDPAESGETDAHEPDFLSAFSALLATVMSGDTRGAQAAARNLQQQIGRAETGADDTRAPGAIGRFFEDLQALIRTARLGDKGGAQSAAESLASDLRNALGGSNLAISSTVVEPSSAAEGATAAYETLMELNQLGVSAA